MIKDKSISDQSLDPEDWVSMRILGHRMVDDMLDHIQNLPSQKVWQHAPKEVKAHFKDHLPLDPQNAEEVYQEFFYR